MAELPSDRDDPAVDADGLDDLPSGLEDFPSDDDPLRELEQRRAQARRAVDEAGGGESEGFELAEAELIEHTSHGDQHTTAPIMRDADLDDLTEAEEDDLYGEADGELKAD
jgi:hypothetical protein